MLIAGDVTDGFAVVVFAEICVLASVRVVCVEHDALVTHEIPCVAHPAALATTSVVSPAKQFVVIGSVGCAID